MCDGESLNLTGQTSRTFKFSFVRCTTVGHYIVLFAEETCFLSLDYSSFDFSWAAQFSLALQTSRNTYMCTDLHL